NKIDIKADNVHKYLFCFDKSIINFETGDWELFNYSEFYNFLTENFIKNNYYVNNGNKETLIFIKHYVDFLKEYIDDYEKYVEDSRILFVKTDGNDDKQNKFWLRLLYSRLRIKLEEYFKNKNEGVEFSVDDG